MKQRYFIEYTAKKKKETDAGFKARFKEKTKVNFDFTEMNRMGASGGRAE